MKKIIILFTILMGSISIGINAQDTFTLKGKVLESGGEPLLFANVKIYRDNKVISSKETDLNGNFSCSLEPGIYDIESFYIGYSSQKLTNLQLTKDTMITLKLIAGNLMDVVEVKSTKPPLITQDNTTSGATVTAEAIRSLPTKNINAIANSASGVSSTSTSGEQYNKIVENRPQNPFMAPKSTFSIDVDRAAYANVRRMLNNGNSPEKDAVRIEEMINYFDYKYPAPTSKSRPFKVHTTYTQCPWNKESRILQIGIQGKKIEMKDLPASNLVFLIDVSGSMGNANKLPLVKESFKLLLGQLRPKDKVAIVTYAGSAGVVLPSTTADQKTRILSAIESLGSGGSTAGAEGIITAYNIARKNFIQNGNNRVVLATDGDFNVGTSTQADLEALIVKQRRSGIFLSVLGYGMGNYQDGKMQTLADKGNGNHNYIDDVAEARKVFVEEFGGTIYTIAKDVKIQIEFNPQYVGTYRLLGYENRMLNNEDFEDDTKDAGELGSGHCVTALYEVTPPKSNYVPVDNGLIYQKRAKELKDNNELAYIKLRYKTPKGHKSWEISEKIGIGVLPEFKINDRTLLAMAVAEFGLLLRDSEFKAEANYPDLIESIEQLQESEFDVDELLALVKKAQELEAVK